MIAQTPPMGWNSWNTFGSEINEEVILRAADSLVASGLAACGYEYVVIDDCWSLPQRDAQGSRERRFIGGEPLGDLRIGKKHATRAVQVVQPIGKLQPGISFF